jgi:ubiquinone/menaquinone biosynthesis C-methylase UbiE
MQQHYTIEEKNLERQHLLAAYLQPFTLRAFNTIGQLQPGAKILDVACGLGETTRLIAGHFNGASITGLDRDAGLIEAAKNITNIPGTDVQYVAGDATHLPFEDNSFDIVFSRYLLMHVPDAPAIIKELKRVCKPGGIVFAQEPDISSGTSYPESWAYDKVQEYFQALFVDGFIGRKLPAYFKQAGLHTIQHQGDVFFEVESNKLRRLYTLTGHAIGGALLAKQLTTQGEYDTWLQELERAENDPETVYLSHAVIAVWGSKV